MNLQLKKSLDILQDGGLADALEIISQEVQNHPFTKFAAVSDNIREEFSMLLSYYGRGVADPHRGDVYRHLRRRSVALVQDMLLEARIQEDSFLTGLRQRAGARADLTNIEAVRGELENYISDVAMLDIIPSGDGSDSKAKRQEMAAAHHSYISQVMAALIVAPHWRDGDVEAMCELLLTPTVDSRDQQMLIGGLTLNVILGGDYHKQMLLIDVYQKSDDVAVSQRALVGWVISLLTQEYNEPLAEERVHKLLADDPSAVSDLLSLQKQIYDCLDARQDTDKIRQEILPNIMKNSDFRITRFGVEEKDDSTNDILDPEASEKAIEEMEAAMRKMRSMIDRGSDIYYGGFSQMKRFPFFYNISNWFCPFFPEHPDLKSLPDSIRESKFLKNVNRKTPFCDSDRYSFVLSLSTIFDRFPASLREMLLNGEGVEMMHGTLDPDDPVVVRRLYVQDIYRFFELFPNKNSFPAVFKMLVRKENGQQRFYPLDHPYLAPLSDLAGIDYYKVSAYLLMRRRDYAAAADLLHKALEQGEDVNVMDNLAHCLSMSGGFEEASTLYARIIEMKGETLPLLRKYCIALTNSHHNDKALELAYKLQYEHPEDVLVKRLLAWNLMVRGDIAKARRYYDELTAAPEASADDWLNSGLCCFLGGDTPKANNDLKKFMQIYGKPLSVKALLDKLTDNGEETQLLALCGKSMEDLELLAEMAKSPDL